MTAWQSLFDELVSRRYPYLVGYALLLTGNRADAEDLVHDALVATFGKRRKLANAGAAEGYVRRAIASRYIDKGRKREREKRAFTRAAGERPGASGRWTSTSPIARHWARRCRRFRPGSARR